jgi:hypothetical protein
MEGLLSLAVEFFRTAPSSCAQNEGGDIVSVIASQFTYGSTQCGLTCNTDQGPFSPIRRGPANNIFAIPVPQVLSFGTGILLSIGSCIPAILVSASVFVFIKQIELGHYDIVSDVETQESVDLWRNRHFAALSGRLFGHDFQLALLGIAVLAIIVLGEINLFSTQLRYGTEPMSNVGESISKHCYT